MDDVGLLGETDDVRWRNFHTRGVSVITHTHVAKPHSPNRVFGTIDSREERDRYWRSIGNARREAGHRRTIPHLEAPLVGERANMSLREACVDEREPRAAVFRRLLARSMIREVVYVDAKYDVRIALSGDGFQAVHQRGLAPETAISRVREVARIIEFVGADGLPRHLPFRGKCFATDKFAGAERRGVGGYRENAIRTERPNRCHREQCRVNTARKGHHNTIQREQRRTQRVMECRRDGIAPGIDVGRGRGSIHRRERTGTPLAAAMAAAAAVRGQLARAVALPAARRAATRR